MSNHDDLVHSHIQLMTAIQDESHKFQECYLWLEKYMHPSFFKELKQEEVMLVAHNLMGFHLQEYFSRIRLKNTAILLSLHSPDADVKVLKFYGMYGIKNYRAFISSDPFPLEGINQKLRITVIHFTEFKQVAENLDILDQDLSHLKNAVKERNNAFSEEEFDHLIKGMNSRFLLALPKEKLVVVLDMYFRAKNKDHCQYEVHYNKDWKEKDLPSMQIILAWKNTPRYNFLYRLARMVHRHGLIMKKVNATYIRPYETKGTLLLSLGLHGSNGSAVWDIADEADFLRELVTMKYFDDFDLIDKKLVAKGIVSGNEGNLLRSMLNFIHQCLLHVDANLYSFENVEEALCRHPELVKELAKLFSYKFHPQKCDMQLYKKAKAALLRLIEKLDTGREQNDMRRKNVLKQGVNFIDYCLKSNYYRDNKTSLSFRMDPKYLDQIPFKRKEKFPELPYAIFFIKGMHFIGFHIRFRDLARGGLRTIFPEKMEHMIVERNNVFTECYSLAYTQQKKNKDIPEGGAKGTIFLKPYERLNTEAEILSKELRNANVGIEEVRRRVGTFLKEQKIEYLYQTQRCFVNSLISLVDCEDDGTLKDRNIVDYWKRPEYIYLGPDENMHTSMIEWIASESKAVDYKPSSAFITSKSRTGINHKEWGVTSFGVNVYMEEVLKYLGIDPYKQKFTVKISGGPDGDVAGNQIHNLYRFYPNTAKLLALTDISGTIFDPQGLDLEELDKLFQKGSPLRDYPVKKLHDESFLLDCAAKKDLSSYVQHTLCWRKKGGKIVKDWLTGSDMNHLFRSNIHKVQADIFIPAGGRPKTLNDSNYHEFLDANGKPSSKAIVEGANLYLTEEARHRLEDLGVLIIKDSSANKCGVIASSFEVLYGLVLNEAQILKNKNRIISQILEILRQCALHEAKLLLDCHKATGERLTVLSDRVSEKINHYMYMLLAHLETVKLSSDVKDPLIRCFLNYCPDLLKKKYRKNLLSEIPDYHKKAIISCRVASQLVYKKGLNWSPSLIDILPLIWKDKNICT